MPNSICSVPNCDKSAHSRTYCHTHYKRWRTTGTPFRKCLGCGGELPVERGLRAYCGPECRPRCKVAECDEPKRSKDGYCARHKALMRRNGEPVGKIEWAPKASTYTCVVCGVEFEAGSGRRKHCSNKCQAIDSTYSGIVPSLDYECVMCGNLFVRNRKDRLHQRGDKKLCDRCRRSRERRHKSSPGYLARRDGAQCGICGELVNLELRHPDPESGSVDHIIPVALGGTHNETNLQLAHLRCNLTKQARADYEPA